MARSRARRSPTADRTAPPRWEEVYRRSIGWVYRLMYSRVGNTPDAEELTSRVFLATLPRLQSTSSDREVAGDLIGTAGTVLADHWQRRSGVALTTVDEGLAGADELRDHLDARRSLCARHLLPALPPDQRSILELRFVSACSVAEAAARLGISRNDAEELQYRALQRAGQLGAELRS